MKKTILIFIVSLLCFQLTSHAQKARVGLSAGVSVSNLSRTIGGVSNDGKFRGGFIGSMIVDAPLPWGKKKRFSFQPGIDYVQKGADEVPVPPVSKKYTVLHYAQVPLNLVYNMKCLKGNFYLGAGPYVALNLPSKKVVVSPDGKSESNVSFGKHPDPTPDDFRGIDYGTNCLMGYRTGWGLFIAATYAQGIRNLYHVESTPSIHKNKIKNIFFGISIGYLFKK